MILTPIHHRHELGDVLPVNSLHDLMNRVVVDAVFCGESGCQFARRMSFADATNMIVSESSVVSFATAIFRSMNDTVGLVIRRRIPAKIAKSIIGTVAVGEMTGLHSRRARTNKRFENQFVNLHRSSSRAKRKFVIAKSCRPRHQSGPFVGYPVAIPATTERAPNGTIVTNGVRWPSGKMPKLDIRLFRKRRQRRNVVHGNPPIQGCRVGAGKRYKRLSVPLHCTDFLDPRYLWTCRGARWPRPSSPLEAAMERRIQLWSCGGGRQSAGIAALILQGRLPRPDHVCMVDTNREKRSTWNYLNAYIKPEIENIGIPFTIIDRSQFATKDLFGGISGISPLMPVFSDQSGKLSKLSEFCSGEWKRDVVTRWAAGQSNWKCQGVDNWIGISYDEKRRRRGPRKRWIQPVYPLLDWITMHVSGCEMAVELMGWPPAPRSCCWMCPNMANAEWRQVRDEMPDQWAMACDLDDELRLTDPNAFCHASLVPLRLADIEAMDRVESCGGCSSGMCV